jgi:hypothetical protein
MPDPIKWLKKAIYSVDTCGDITGYDCNWLITGAKAFEKHLAEQHPEGEHR